MKDKDYNWWADLYMEIAADNQKRKQSEWLEMLDDTGGHFVGNNGETRQAFRVKDSEHDTSEVLNEMMINYVKRMKKEEKEKEEMDQEKAQELMNKKLKEINDQFEAEMKLPKNKAKILANEHFKYVGDLMSLVSEARQLDYSDEELDLFEFLYKTAFIHGYKHAMEDK